MFDQICSALNLDSTIGVQLVIAILFFIGAKYLFFNKLKFVLLTRESQTTKLEEGAEKNFDKAKALSDKYKNLINDAYTEAQSLLNREKAETIVKDQKLINQAEQEAEKYVDSKRIQITADLNEKKTAILSEADSLTKQLVEKVIQ